MAGFNSKRTSKQKVGFKNKKETVSNTPNSETDSKSKFAKSVNRDNSVNNSDSKSKSNLNTNLNGKKRFNVNNRETSSLRRVEENDDGVSDNELEKCDRCGELVSADDMVHGFCPSCLAYIEKE